jgi:DNA-binding beta-propeller fold protein YncE
MVGLAVSVGCSSPPGAPGLPAAPEPAVAPPTSVAPAGRVLALPLESLPEGVAADPATGDVAVALRRPDRMAVVKADALRLLHIVLTPGRARHLVLEKPGGPILLPGEDTDELVQLSLPRGRILAAAPVGKQPHNASYADGRIFVADELDSTIDVVDATTSAVLATLHGPLQPGGTAVVRGVVSAVDVRGGRLYTWSEKTLQPLGSVAIGDGPTHEAPAGHGLLLVNDTRGDEVLLVDPVTRRVVGRLAMPGTPYGIAVDPAGGRAWITLTATNELVQLAVTGESIHVTNRWPTVQQPNTVAYEPSDRCVFVAGMAQSQLQRVCHLPGSAP